MPDYLTPSTATPTITGRAADRDAFVLANGAELVGGSDLHCRKGWQILTHDGWQTITEVEGRPWSSLHVFTVESDEPWIRSTDPDADSYLALVRYECDECYIRPDGTHVDGMTTQATEAALDAPLFDQDHALNGSLTTADIAHLETEFAVAKVDLWCASSALTNAATTLRHAANLPAAAPALHALTVAQDLASSGDQRAARAVASFEQAATSYEAARSALDEIRDAALRTPAARP